MQKGPRRPGRYAVRCTLCGQEITRGEEYWACNGSCVCAACLVEFARKELCAFHETRGKETLK